MVPEQKTATETARAESPETAVSSSGTRYTAHQPNPASDSPPAAGAEMLGVSQEVGGAGEVPIAAGVEAMPSADRKALLSHLAAAAGVRDLAEGTELLGASQNLDAMSAIVAGISAEDLEDAMDLASISGQLAAASDVVAELAMPVLSAFLSDRGRWLREIAVDTFVRFGAARALSAMMDETGWQLDDLAVGEIAEGLEELAGAEALAESERFAGAAAPGAETSVPS